MGKEEHRRAPRIARSFMFRYRCPAAGQTDWLASPLRDLSSGGARLLSEGPFVAGTTLEAQLLLPTAPQPILLQARVAWAHPTAGGLTELGVTFDPGDAAIQKRLDEAVTYFLQKEGRG